MGRTSDARRRLMEAAFQLICEYSYGAVTIDAICERAGVKKGSFYHFFESKSDLAITAINDWWGARERVIAEIFTAEKSPLDRLRAYFDFISSVQLRAFEKNGQILGAPLLGLGAETSIQDARICQRVVEFLSTLQAIFAKTIREAQAEGGIEDGDPEAKARALISVYEGLLSMARIEKNPEQVRNLTRDVLATLGVRKLTGATP